MNIKITPNDKGNPPGKLADAELHFHRRSARWAEVDRVFHLGTPERQRPERHLSGEAIHRQRRAASVCAAQTHHGRGCADQGPRSDPRRVSAVRRAGGGALMSDDQRDGRPLPPTDLFSHPRRWNTRSPCRLCQRRR